jgi:hydrogenase nickel incorporation protein HypB
MDVRKQLNGGAAANGAGAGLGVAQANRAVLRAAGVFTVNLIGGFGCGKSALIRSAVERLAPDRRIGVIVADSGPHQRDLGAGAVVRVNADPHLPLTAAHVRAALGRMDLGAIDVLLVENVPSLADPVACDLGEAARVCVFSVAAGDAKAAEHPEAIRRADLVVLNKTDLLPLVPFDVKSFRCAVRRANPRAEVAQTSAVAPEGASAWVEWLRARASSSSSSEAGGA